MGRSTFTAEAEASCQLRPNLSDSSTLLSFFNYTLRGEVDES